MVSFARMNKKSSKYLRRRASSLSRFLAVMFLTVVFSFIAWNRSSSKWENLENVHFRGQTHGGIDSQDMEQPAGSFNSPRKPSRSQIKAEATAMLESISIRHLEGHGGLTTKGTRFWLFGMKCGVAMRGGITNPVRELTYCPHGGDWPICSVYHEEQEQDCVVYSFGINREWMYDDAWASRGCLVHSFDPTTHLRSVHERHAEKHGLPIKFHFQGLGGKATEPMFKGLGSRVTEGYLSGKLDTLNEIIEEIGDTDRIIESLKIDIEGHEWGAIAYLADLEDGRCVTLKNVKELLIEFHFGHFEGTESPTLETILKVLYYVYETCGFRNIFLNTKGAGHWYEKSHRTDIEFPYLNPSISTMLQEVMDTGIHPNFENLNVGMINPRLVDVAKVQETLCV